MESRSLELRCHSYRSAIMHWAIFAGNGWNLFMGILWNIMSVITVIIINTLLYPPKPSLSAAAFLSVLLLSLDRVILRFPKSEVFSLVLSSYTNLVSCEPTLSSLESLIPVAFLICLLTTSTSCNCCSNTLAFKNWAWWGSLGTTEDNVEHKGGDAEATCTARLAQSMRNSVCDGRRGCAEWFIWEICHDHSEN